MKFLDKIKKTLSKFAPGKPKPISQCASGQDDEPVAQAQDTATEDAPKQDQPKPPWKLRVRVKSRDPKRRPDSVNVQLEGDDPKSSTIGMVGQTEECRFEGTGSRNYKAKASADNWELVSDKDVTLADGDDKQVELELRPKPWVEFRAEDKNGKVVTGVTFKVELPGGVKKSEISTDRNAKFEGLTPGTCKIEELSHDEVWEVTEVSSS